MKVEIVSYSVVAVPSALEGAGYHLHEDTVNSADELAEFVDRHYHHDLERTTSSTRVPNRDMVGAAIASGYTSIFDHAFATFVVSDATRRLAFELDSRFHANGLKISMEKFLVNGDNVHFMVPEAISRHDGLAACVEDLWEDSTLKAYLHLCERLEAKGHSYLEAARIAECILPNALNTSLVVSGTMSTWRDVTLLTRLPGSASEEAVRFATKALVHLKGIAPHTFQDR